MPKCAWDRRKGEKENESNGYVWGGRCAGRGHRGCGDRRTNRRFAASDEVMYLRKRPLSMQIVRPVEPPDVPASRTMRPCLRRQAPSRRTSLLAAVRLPYIEELLTPILDGDIDPGRVFDSVIRLDEVSDGYRAMNERESLKVMIAN